MDAHDHIIGSLEAKSSISAAIPANTAFFHAKEARSHAREDCSHAREDCSRTREDRSHAREDHSHAREDRSHAREERSHTREDRSRTREERSHTREDATFRPFRSSAARTPAGFAELNFPFIRFEDNWKEVKAIWQITQKILVRKSPPC